MKRLPATLVRGQGGFSLIEVVITMLLLGIGSLAVLGLVNASTKNSYRAEQSQVVVSQLQAELERIKQMPYEQVALTGSPASSASEADPGWRVSGSQFALGRDGTDMRQLVTNGSALAGGGSVSGGMVTPAATNFTSGDVVGTLRRFIVWVNDPRCPDAICPGAQDIKRIVVAATINSSASGGVREYQEIQSDVVDPDVTPVVDTDQVPGGGGADDDEDGDGVPDGDAGNDDDDTFATFWLTDTPCSQAERQPQTGDHSTHNTLGTCGAGVKTGDTPGAPDLMFTDQPPLIPNLPPDQQPTYDYSTDVEPVTGASEDRGLQLRTPTLPGCTFSPSLVDGTPGQKVHRWLSPPVPSGAQLLLDGDATLSLWTRSVNGATQPGRICVFLYARKLNVLGVPVDVPMVNASLPNVTWFEHFEDVWPHGAWSEVNIEMEFLYAAGALLPGERLGVAIAVEKSGTAPGDGLEFLYDHPSFDSRLQIRTSSVLPIFD